MTWHRFPCALLLGVVAASRLASAQAVAAPLRAPNPPISKVDALAQELQPYMPNHGTLAMGGGDTLIYTSVLTGTRRIPLGDVDAAIFRDSARAGFQCAGTRACILFEPGTNATSHAIQMLSQVTWGIGSVRKNADREMKFQVDSVPFKRVSDALASLLADWKRVRVADAGTVSPSSAAELAIRQKAMELMNLPAGRWTTMMSSSGVTVGVDLQAVRTENGNRVAWVRTGFAPPQKFPEGYVSTVFTEQRFDCAGKRTQAIQTVLGLPDRVVARARDPGNRWASVANDSTVRGILERVCGAP